MANPGAGGLRGDGARHIFAFARKFPGHYMAMFESGTSMNATPELGGRRGPIPRAVLEQAAEALSGAIFPPEKTPAPVDVLGPCLGR